MASIVPVPVLSLCTARMLETMVCGNEQVDIQVLKKVARYCKQCVHMCQCMYFCIVSCMTCIKSLVCIFYSKHFTLHVKVS